MNRRQYLFTTFGSGLSSLAGCSTLSGNQTARNESSGINSEESSKTPKELAARGNPDDICQRSIRLSTQIKAILEPSFASDWSETEIKPKYSESGKLAEHMTVIGLEVDGRSRAYPLTVLTVHEIVNDVLNRHFMVTYCPLCRSAIVANRRIQNGPTTFHVSGLLWNPPKSYLKAQNKAKGARPEYGANQSALLENSNLVMYDRATGSFWSQIVGKAICGPLRGRSLEIMPFEIATWSEWQDTHTQTEVLLPPPHSSIDNTRD